jgi:hypothetical protein
VRPSGAGVALATIPQPSRSLPLPSSARQRAFPASISPWEASGEPSTPNACNAGSQFGVVMNALGRAWTYALAASLLVAVGCSGETRQPSSPPPTAQSVSTLSEQALRSCPATVPNGQHPASVEGFGHGNGSLWVALWPRGRLIAGTLPDGSSWAVIKPDGSIDAKLGWWRGVEGPLTIQGMRLDADAPPLRADISQGYGVSGFQPTGIIFPTEGCWRVTGEVGDATLSFVTLVVKRQP